MEKMIVSESKTKENRFEKRRNERTAALRQFVETFDDVLSRGRVETGRWFVEEENGRRQDQIHADIRSSTFAT